MGFTAFSTSTTTSNTTPMKWSRSIGSFDGMHHDPRGEMLWKIAMKKFGRVKLHYGQKNETTHFLVTRTKR